VVSRTRSVFQVSESTLSTVGGAGERLEKMKCMSKVLIRERGNLKSLWRCLEIYQ